MIFYKNAIRLALSVINDECAGEVVGGGSSCGNTQIA